MNIRRRGNGGVGEMRGRLGDVTNAVSSCVEFLTCLVPLGLVSTWQLWTAKGVKPTREPILFREHSGQASD